MISKKLLLFTIFSFLILLASCEQQDSPYVYHQPENHADGWESEDLSDVGIDTAKLESMVDDIQDGSYENLHSILVVKDGKLVFEEYFQGYNWYTKHYVTSVTKSVTSALIGIAIEQGYIAGSDQILSELLPEYADLINADTNRKSLKLKHILTMTSGIEWDEETHPYGHPQNDCERMQSGGDMVGYVLERPVINEPGTHFQYSCANTMLLSAVIKTQTGINADEFAEKYLFEPLGITDYKWETYTGGLSQTDGGLHLRPRDLAKIGLLYLNDGRWDGQQVIPKAWVDESTRAHIPVILNAKYGFQWWMVDTPAGFNNISTYFASGFGGQRIYVYPSLDLVVVFTHEVNAESDLKNDDTFLLRKYILPSLGADDPSSWVIGLWIALLVTSLVVITWDLTRKDDFSISIWLSWVWVTLIFGPIGWIIYKVTTRHLEDLKGLWRGALSASFYSASGNASGYILFLLLVTVIQPQNDLGLLSVLAPYLAGWFIFRSLPLVCWLGKGYINALRHSFLAEIISTNFVLAGMQSMLIFLQFRWFGLGDVNLSDVMFWVMISTSAMVGAVFVFPFNYWMTRRGYMLWPNRMAQSDDDATQDTSKVSTSLRDSWWVLLLSIIFFIVCLGLTLTLIY